MVRLWIECASRRTDEHTTGLQISDQSMQFGSHLQRTLEIETFFRLAAKLNFRGELAAVEHGSRPFTGFHI